MFDQYFWDRQINDAPLNQRAWVFQERLLSPRVIHFGQIQLLWECHELGAAELCPSGLSFPLFGQYSKLNPGLLDNPYIEDLRFGPPAPLSLRDSSPTDSYERSPYNAWASLVESYSRGDLTKPEDKLPAASGVAKIFSTVIPGEYIAGMWRQTLERDLLWEALKEPKRVAKYRSPSFSWVSMDGPVNMPNEKSGFVWRVLDVQIKHLTADTTGQVTSGILRLQGKVTGFHFDLKHTDLDEPYLSSDCITVAGTTFDATFFWRGCLYQTGRRYS
ncbi:hypothetical protein M8818_004778 [Zalaria obscura]|uniref:Uncharacterized protein n=1 Tax=Zalaria obscura TaxID=2024903 RepID=A0ACC3SB20_9PEZI